MAVWPHSNLAHHQEATAAVGLGAGHRAGGVRQRDRWVTGGLRPHRGFGSISHEQATHPSLGTVVSVRNSYVLLTGLMLSLPSAALSTSVVWY